MTYVVPAPISKQQMHLYSVFFNNYIRTCVLNYPREGSKSKYHYIEVFSYRRRGLSLTSIDNLVFTCSGFYDFLECVVKSPGDYYCRFYDCDGFLRMCYNIKYKPKNLFDYA